MALNRTFTLHDGNVIPAVGFGTWQAKPHEVEHAVEIALRAGYKHIDCASIYRNETEVGAGITKSGVNRKDIFVRLHHITYSSTRTIEDRLLTACSSLLSYGIHTTVRD